METALYTIWFLYIIYITWLQFYYKNLYRNEVKKYCDMRKKKIERDDKVEELKTQLLSGKRLNEDISLILSRITYILWIKSTTDNESIINTIKEKINELGQVKENEKDLSKMLEEIQKEVKSYMVLWLNTTWAIKQILKDLESAKHQVEVEKDAKGDIILEFEAYKTTAANDRVSFKNFTGKLENTLWINWKPSELIIEVWKIKKLLKEKDWKEDIYYKKEILSEFKKKISDNFETSFVAALTFYTSKQRIKTFESFFKKMQKAFNWANSKININDFSTLDNKNDWK